MPAIRPIIDTFLQTPWVADEPVGPRPVKEIVPQQVQVAFVGDGPVQTRQIVPLTQPARDLLYGASRVGAHRFFRGVLAGIQGREGVSELRGMSFSADRNAFATNMMMSNIESGFIPDSIGSGDQDTFREMFQGFASATPWMRAQNTGWLDLGPETTRDALRIIRFGRRAGTDTVERAALTIKHETEHSITPSDPETLEQLGWLEEGTAEALTWWPGATSQTAAAIGVPLHREPDAFTAPNDQLPSPKYRGDRTSVGMLLDLAGVRPFHADGTPDQAGRRAAQQLLQGSQLSQVPRNIARAIARHNGLPSSDVGALTQLIRDLKGDPKATRALVQAVTRRDD